MNLNRFKPAVPQKWLLGLAGILWSVVGIMLCVQAVFWMGTVTRAVALFLFLLSMGLSYGAYRFLFYNIATTNINRITGLAAESCIFAFQAWKSYILILIMIILGITLRHSSIPKHYLSVIYLTIGGALFLSSLRYYVRLKSPISGK